jgi:hypothetical protein
MIHFRQQTGDATLPLALIVQAFLFQPFVLSNLETHHNDGKGFLGPNPTITFDSLRFELPSPSDMLSPIQKPEKVAVQERIGKPKRKASMFVLSLTFLTPFAVWFLSASRVPTRPFISLHRR